MRLGVLFLVLAGALAALAALASPGPGILSAWPALSFALVGAAYLAGRPAWLGKRADGTLAPWAWALLGPYLGLTWALWALERRITREAAASEVAPGLWVGRRPGRGEVPSGVTVIVDLTAELPAARPVRAHPGYRCAPTLDGEPPGPELLRGLVQSLRDREGVLLHCASGHGRSATVAAALLIARGLAGSVEEAEARLRARRPGIGLRAGQRRAVAGVSGGASRGAQPTTLP